MYEPKVIRITVLVLLVVGSLVDAQTFTEHRAWRDRQFASKPRMMTNYHAGRPKSLRVATRETTSNDLVASTPAAATTVDTITFAEPLQTTYSTKWAPEQPSIEPVTATPSAETAGTNWPTTSGSTEDSASILPTTTTKTVSNYTTTVTSVGPRTPGASTTAGEETKDSLRTTWIEMTTPSSTDPIDDFSDAETTKVATPPSQPLVFTTSEDQPARTTFHPRKIFATTGGQAGVKDLTITTDSTSEVLETTPAMNELSTTKETPKPLVVHSADQSKNDTANDNADAKNSTDPGPTITTETPESIDRFREAMSAALEMIFDDGKKTPNSKSPLTTTQLPAVVTEDVTTTPSPSIETVTVIDFSTHPPTDETTETLTTGIRKLVTGNSIDEVPTETTEQLELKLEMVMQRLKEASDAMDDFYRQIGQQVNTLDEKVSQYIARPKSWKNCIQRPVDARKWLTADMLEMICENGQFMKRIELRRGPLGSLSVECCTME